MKTELIVALDVDSASQAFALVERMGPEVEWVKVGKQLFTGNGPEVVKKLREDYGKKVFLDLKFHDIPNTVGQAVAAVARLGVEMTNVHASGGRAMLQAAATAAGRRLKLLAVTLLTSLDVSAMREVGWESQPDQQVLRLARLSAAAGLAGVVCSACEIALLRREMEAGFCLVVPGIRPDGSDAGDQKRVMTPEQAVRAGADYIVVGRPITAAPEPAAAVAAISRSMQMAMREG